MTGLWPLLEQLKSYKWVDLSHPLTEESPYWSGMPDGAVNLNQVVVDFDSEYNLQCMVHTFPGQFGTHIDFPGHFIPGKRLLKDFDIKEVCLPMVVIDLSAKVAENINYGIAVEDIEEFEAANGRIPEGSFVAMRTDWSKRWPDMDALSGFDADGNENFPGWTMPALKLLIEERGIAGIGHETLDTDSSEACAAAGDLACERYLLDHDRFQLEVMTNLDQLPPTGAILFVGFPKVMEANGMPVRAWAVIPN